MAFRVSLLLWMTSGLHGQPVINEIHYDPPNKSEPAEFIEIHNPSGTQLPLGGWTLAGGVDFTFPPQASIEPEGYLVVAQDPSFLKSAFGVDALGPWTGRLRNEDERVELRDPTGILIDRVGFQLGFPWPTVGTPPGDSIELIHPSLDNELGGNWRASVAGGIVTPTSTALIPIRSTWQFFRGFTAPSDPPTDWRVPGFDAVAWETGPLPIGYDPGLPLGTSLDDMRNGYTTVYLRRTFTLNDTSAINSIELQALYDDGFRVWINGRFVLEANVAPGELDFDATAGSARESNAYETFSALLPPGVLVPGDNVIAVQALNSSLNASSDFYFDARLDGISGPTHRGPTPGRINMVHATRAPPAIRQVDHSPSAPHSGVAVRVTARITDPEGVVSVSLAYQVVEPGAYIELSDPEYEAEWTSLAMRDDGTGGDLTAGDRTYTATIPEAVQRHRRLIRYRISAADTDGAAVRVPYPDDPQPNFAYFVHDGVPAWSAAIRPGDSGALGQVFTVDADEMNRLPVLHLIAKRETVEECTWFSRYGGDAYPWSGTLVFEGRVYDHIRFRARGGVWRYAMAKNMWKFDFHRGHDFQAIDDWGRPLDVLWTKLNLGASIQQGDYNHRGEQGMFESVGFRVFQLAGVPSMHSAFAQFRVIDDDAEAPADDQYDGDFWGVYLLLEQPDGRFLDQHGLPDGNLYKMEGGGGEANNVGPSGPADGSDLSAFLQQYSTTSESWWRSNFNIPNYLSYQTVVQAIHHYDICYDKNFFYYINPVTQLWQVIPWDLDLTWAENMYDAGCGGVDRIKQRLLPNATRFPAIWRAWQNRIREFRDLFWNADEAGRLIDENAARLRGPTTGPTLLDADRAQWDYNPRMIDPDYTSAGTGKAGHGRYYRWPSYPASVASRDFNGCVQLMKRYVGFRATNSAARARALDELAADASIPTRPVIESATPPNHPVDALRFRSSPYAGAAPFARLRWRIGEITRPGSTQPDTTANEPWKYEITPVWESGDFAAFDPEIAIPAGVLRVGGVYRTRVQVQDAEGRNSQWSEPAEFVAGPPAETPAIGASLRLTELMFNAPGDSTNDFLELYNAGNTTLNLGGLSFTKGIDFVLPTSTMLAPGGYLVVTRAIAANNYAAFRGFYGLATIVPIVGPYSGNLNDAGEELALSTAAGGQTVFQFTYSDGREWPLTADGAGHSLVPRQDFGADWDDALNFGGNWRASAYLLGSPGRADPEPDTSVVLNEIVAHTDFQSEFDSNDWIELFNRTASPIALGEGWYLSDTADTLKRWRIPAGAVLPANGYLVFDEVTGFNNPRDSGFSINKAAESVFLSHFAAGTPGRVIDAIAFKGQQNDWALARIPDGGTYWEPVSPRTRNAANPPLSPRVVLSELLYHEGGLPTNVVPAEYLEFVELHNAIPATTALFNENGAWRLNGGIDFQFNQLVTLAVGERILIVGWDPTLNPTFLSGFRQIFGMPANVRVFGPYTGRLGNNTDRIALERPQAPDVPGDPITWVIVDEVAYHESTPWPGGADGTGQSYQRLSATAAGSDPSNWRAAAPSPGSGIPSGTVDTDGDTMPDAWEIQYGLDPQNPADALLDADNDGSSNAGEYTAGTDPRDRGSVLRITEIGRDASGQIVFVFPAVAGKSYQVEASATAAEGTWNPIQTLPAPNQATDVTVRIAPGAGDAIRFFRVRVS